MSLRFRFNFSSISTIIVGYMIYMMSFVLSDKLINNPHLGYNHLSDEMNEQLRNGLFYGKGIELKSCRQEEHIFASPDNFLEPCKYRSINVSSVKSESDLIHIVLEFCEEEYRLKPVHFHPYATGYGSLLECLRITSNFVLTNIYENAYSSKARIRSFHPIVDVPRPDGCEVNWLWDLPDFEESVFSQVPTLS
jgi:hypothetical protein